MFVTKPDGTPTGTSNDEKLINAVEDGVLKQGLNKTITVLAQNIAFDEASVERVANLYRSAKWSVEIIQDEEAGLYIELKS
jgi:hypothetical protein